MIHRAVAVPELLAPAGSVDAVRAAVANGADSIYLGASMYNARDEGAQLSLDELGQACAIAHERGVRVYLTFNVLMKPHELVEALTYLGECIDRGIDAAIVQDLGVVRLIQRIYPQLEIHGSTQMTVHDASGARVMNALGVKRVVLARENTLEDIQAIREAVPELGLESFVHGAICISYSGQCFMSGMISERSANRGSCAQSCRKDYVLRDEQTGDVLDRGYLISARDMAAHDHLERIAELGISCLKIEGRKKKPEYVATVSKAYRGWLDAISRGERGRSPSPAEIEPLVQIFSRGNTGGMYGGRQGRDYVTRTQPDNRGLPLGVVLGTEGSDLIVETTRALAVGDGLGFESPASNSAASLGGTVQQVVNIGRSEELHRQRISVRSPVALKAVAAGWKVVRTSDVTLLGAARQSFASVNIPRGVSVVRTDVRCFGHAGGPLKSVWSASGHDVTVASDIALVPAGKHSLGVSVIREHFGRLGGTSLVLGSVDVSGMGADLFLPLAELNRMRQAAAEQLSDLLEWDHSSDIAERIARIEEEVDRVRVSANSDASGAALPVMDRARAFLERDGSSDAGSDISDGNACQFSLRAVVYDVDHARLAAAGGATEIVFDPFLRHPAPSRARILKLREELESAGILFRLRTPSIVRPEERRKLEPWLAMETPLLVGHLGLVGEFGPARDVIADYAVNAFNQHTAQVLFDIGASRITASIELTVQELGDLVMPWEGRGFDVVIHGRPEGMTIEHCVLSAAFDREPTTCRDLCVQKHPLVSLTDPAGYTFGVATDSACRNRLLHSRPIDGAEYLSSLWQIGFRGFHMVFNVPGDPIEELVRAYRFSLDELAGGAESSVPRSRELLNGGFTRGHFVRAV